MRRQRTRSTSVPTPSWVPAAPGCDDPRKQWANRLRQVPNPGCRNGSRTFRDPHHNRNSSGGAAMPKSLKNSVGQYLGKLNRRDLLRRGGLMAALPAFLGGTRTATAATPTTAGQLQLGPDIYKSIGVRPFINCR